MTGAGREGSRTLPKRSMSIWRKTESPAEPTTCAEEANKTGMKVGRRGEGVRLTLRGRGGRTQTHNNGPRSELLGALRGPVRLLRQRRRWRVPPHLANSGNFCPQVD